MTTKTRSKPAHFVLAVVLPIALKTLQAALARRVAT